MDTPSTGQSVKILTTLGDGNFIEGDYVLPPIDDYSIRVKSIFTGVCRSDIDMMQGNFPLLPMQMHGHEGLGQVVERGSKVKDWDCKIGDYVATRGEPAYADYYNCKPLTWVKVPQADPKYIIEPIACGINIARVCEDELHKRDSSSKRMLIIGTGFLARIFYQTLQALHYTFDTEVLGFSNKEFWGNKLVSEPNGSYDIVLDLKDDATVMDINFNNNGLLILGAQKRCGITTNFGDWLWKNITIKMPSPRAETFISSMSDAVELIDNGKITLDNVWTHSYNRDNNWQQAFADAVKRPGNYSRGYISWD